MKKKLLKKRILGLVLCLACLVSLIRIPITSQAATSKELVKYVQTTISADYRGDTKTAPEAPEGYVFAGWYKTNSASSTGYSPMTEEEADAAVNGDTVYYAKYVVESVLYLKWQISNNTVSTSTSTNLRLLTTVDSLDYKAVGFHISIGNQSATYTSDTVFSSVNGFVDNQSQVYVPTVFSMESDYFMTVTINNVTDFDVQFKVTPVWKTIDGTKVSGVRRLFKINDAFTEKNITNGYGFETLTDFANFTSSTVEGEGVKLSPAAYVDTNLQVPDATYGRYAMKGELQGTWPTVDIQFNETLTLSGFKYIYANVYFECDTATSEATLTQVLTKGYLNETQDGSYASHNGSSDKIPFNQWTKVGFLFYDAEINTATVQFNLDGSGVEWSDVTMYIDCVCYGTYTYAEPEEETTEQPATITEGFGFERENDINSFTVNQQLTLSRAAYTDTTISASDTSYGDYVLKGTLSGNYPTLDIAFNETLASNTWYEVTASVYVESSAATSSSKINYVQTRGYLNGVAQDENRYTHWTSDYLYFNQWKTVTFQLYNSSTDGARVQFNMENSGVSWDTITIYIDNVIYGTWPEPEVQEPTARNIVGGITFENRTETESFSGLTGLTRAKYSEEGLTIASGDGLGTYGLKGTTDSSTLLTVNFDETIGVSSLWSAVCFKAYVKADGATGTYSIAGGTHSVACSSLAFNEWVDVEIPSYGTYSSNSYSFDLGDVTGATIYVDSFVYAPPLTENNIYTFEDAVQTTVSSGVGQLNVSQPSMGEGAYANVSRVAYLDTPLGLTVPNEVGLYGYQVPIENARTYFHLTTPLLKYADAKTVKMRIYIACDEALAEKITVLVRAWQYNNEGNFQAISDSSSTISLNQWIDVEFSLGDANTWRKSTAIRFRTVDKTTNGDYEGTDLNYTVYVDNIDLPAFN